MTYLPGVEADVYRPEREADAPVVVLVPGGGWRTAERGGMAPLAELLAGSGAVAVNASYRAGDAGATIAEEVADVICAVDAAVATVGAGHGPVVVVGHSAGAHLAALASLATERFRGACPWPAASVDGLVGLAGLYDPSEVAGFVAPLLGVGARGAVTWEDVDASTWSAERPHLPVLLLHGDADVVVPPHSSAELAAHLARAGHPVEHEVLVDAGHADVYQAVVVGPRLVAWIAALPDPPADHASTS
jgi:acetyl esterase/lipase